MRKILVATVAAVVVSGGALAASHAEAMTLTAPAGVRAAIDQTSVVEKTRYICYRTWRYGGWRRVCSWRPSYYPYYAYRPYYYGGYPYYHRPYAYHQRPGVGFYFRF